MNKPCPSGELPGMPESCARDFAGSTTPAATRPRVKAVDRSQLTWQMLDVERLVEADHPVRAVWELVGRLDLSGYYAAIEAVEGAAGRTPWDPRLLVSLWV